MTVYTIVLSLHGIIRWLVMITAAFALFRAYSGLLRRRDWTRADRTAGMLFGISMDSQLLLGLILYFFLSPITRAVLQNFGAAFSAGGDLAFFGIEHIVGMLIAVILAHIGSSASRRAEHAVVKHRNAAIWFTLSVLAVIIATPWWRPLLRI